jgi:8-oxo-dGTP diphosphatase
MLLGRRAPHLRSYPDCWDIIGGHVETGESLEQTLARELKEEIDVAPISFAHLTSLRFLHGTTAAALHVYRVTRWTGEPVIADREHTELRWFDVEAACALADLASPKYRAVFRVL